MQSIEKLKKMGFKIFLYKDKIKIKQEIKEVNIDTAKELIRNVKEHKTEAIQYLKKKTFNELFDQITEEINTEYLKNDINSQVVHENFKWINLNPFYVNFRESQDKVDRAWIQEDIEGFKEALSEMKICLLAMIPLYKGTDARDKKE